MSNEQKVISELKQTYKQTLSMYSDEMHTLNLITCRQFKLHIYIGRVNFIAKSIYNCRGLLHSCTVCYVNMVDTYKYVLLQEK